MLYAIVQSPYLLNVGTNGKTLLQGVYESTNGDPNGPWTKIATVEQAGVQRLGAERFSGSARDYGPGIQAWYNQFLVVDPANKDHVYLGLEEVYETPERGRRLEHHRARTGTSASSCFSYSPFEGTCNHNQAHSDQHAAVIAGGKLYVGNDGGVYARPLTDHAVGDWANLNAHLDVLQYYAAQGSARLDHLRRPAGQRQQQGLPDHRDRGQDDHGNTITVSSVQVFGGDGGYTLVDPANSNNVITEYTELTALKSTDGGSQLALHRAVRPRPALHRSDHHGPHQPDPPRGRRRDRVELRGRRRAARPAWTRTSSTPARRSAETQPPR